jgi:hypothetical protein
VGIGKNGYRHHGATGLWSESSTSRGIRGTIASFGCKVNKYCKNNLPFHGEVEDVAGAACPGIGSYTQVDIFGSAALTFLNRGTFQAVSRPKYRSCSLQARIHHIVIYGAKRKIKTDVHIKFIVCSQITSP